MPPNKDDATRWRELAAEARQFADEVTELRAKQIMLKIADSYEHLARLARARKESRE